MKIKNIFALLFAILDAVLCCVDLAMFIIDKRPLFLFHAFLMGFYSLYFLQLALERKPKRKKED